MDPIHQAQLALRGAARVLRSRGLLSGSVTRQHREARRFRALADASVTDADGADTGLPLVPPAWRADAATRELFFETGRKGLARLGRDMEAHTGASLESRTALDFGCGLGRFTLALAESCERVYGVDRSLDTLRRAERNAQHKGLTNIAWLETDRLAELSGRYDLLLSVDVFQHIPARVSERLLATLLHGLRGGGVGAIDVALRPSHPLAGQLASARASRGQGASRTRGPLRGWDASYLYMLMNSLSLTRLGRLLVAAGIRDWHVQFHRASPMRAYDGATIVFLKDPTRADGNLPGAELASPSAPTAREATPARASDASPARAVRGRAARANR